MSGDTAVAKGYLNCNVLEQYIRRMKKEGQVLCGKDGGLNCSCHYHLDDASIAAVRVVGTLSNEWEDHEHPLEETNICFVSFLTTNPEKYQEMLNTLKYSEKALMPKK